MQFNINDRNALQRFRERNKRRIKSFMRMATIELYRRLMVVSPVDTGNFRWNWWCQVNGITTRYETHENRGIDLNRPITIFSDFELNDSLYICNSTPYAKKLNEGWSKQAPARFVEITVSGVQNDVNKLLAQAIKEAGE